MSLSVQQRRALSMLATSGFNGATQSFLIATAAFDPGPHGAWKTFLLA
jgi:hypothetical protein